MDNDERVRAPSPEFQNTETDGFTTSLSTAALNARARKVYDMKIIEGKSYVQIADELGIDQGTARRAYTRAQKVLIPSDDTDEARITALEKLQYDEQFVRAIMESDHVLVSFGKVVTDSAGQAQYDLMPKLQAFDRLLKIYKERRDIMGYTAPSKRVLEVVSEDTFDKAIRELNERAAELEREAERKKDVEAL